MTFSAKKIELYFIPSISGKSVEEMTKDELVVEGNCFVVLHYKSDQWNSRMEELDTVEKFRAKIPATGGGSAAIYNNGPYEPRMTPPNGSERRRRGKSKRRNTKKQRKTRRRLRK